MSDQEPHLHVKFNHILIILRKINMIYKANNFCMGGFQTYSDCNCSMFCCVLLCVQYCSFAIILMGKKELVDLLYLQFVIVVFPDHTQLLF